MPKQILNIVKVEWEDICETMGWFPLGTEPKDIVETAKVTSVGIKLGEDKKYLYLTNSHGAMHGDEQVGSVTIIPKGCIISIKTLLKSKKEISSCSHG